ncbi:MAG: Fe-S cluster assembly protein SufD [Chitinophagaceae bacterium]
MNTNTYFKEYFDRLQSTDTKSGLGTIRQNAFDEFNKMGIPTLKQEAWKYTRISSLFEKDYQFTLNPEITSITASDIEAVRMPGHEQANELFFLNGLLSFSLSVIRSPQLIVQPLEEAATNEYQHIVKEHFGHSSDYIKDGINALNTALVHGGVFIHVKKGQLTEHPVYIYHLSDAGFSNTFSQPRSLVHVSENAGLQIVETFATIGRQESFTNQVIEIVVEKDARVEYYKIQNDSCVNSQVSTTHIRHIGKSYTNTVIISLDGNIVRNNLNIVFEADHCESHLYGLYCLNGHSHIDNHTIVDNVKPNCLSNTLYKGIVDDVATGIFNGKIFVRKDAQKTNAYQSNKNVLLSTGASVNTKPQLEIFADDVKCSHGCTVGSLDEEALFYLRSRGVDKDKARSLLLHAFAKDILENIKSEPIKMYVNQLISERLQIEIL